MNSSLLVYSVINNLGKIINTDIEIEEIDIFNVGSNRFRFLKTAEYFRVYCKKIYNDIENHYYNYSDMILFICHQYIFDTKINLKDINNKNVNEIVKIYSKEQLEKDKEFVKSIIQKSILKNFNELFTIKEDGESIVYALILHKYISPFFFIFTEEKKRLTSEIKDVILNNKYERFLKITKIITKILKGELK